MEEKKINIDRFDGPIVLLDDHVSKVADVLAQHDRVFARVSEQWFGEEASKVNPIVLGMARQGIHIAAGNSSPRFFKKNVNLEDIIGVWGERAFGMEFGLPVDTTLNHQGDKHIDFKSFDVVGNKKVTIDVKTARIARNLYVKQKEISEVADIVVLAGFKGTIGYSFATSTTVEIELLGWEYGSEMKKCGLRTSEYGITNHFKGVACLRDMPDLKSLLGITLAPMQPLGVKTRLMAEMASRGYACQSVKSGIHFWK